MKNAIKYLPYILIFVLLFLLIINKCATNRQQSADIGISVSENQIENLNQTVKILEAREVGYSNTVDSMMRINSALNRRIIENRNKLIDINKLYEKELTRVQQLPDDSAVGLFLDTSDCPDCEIIKYDSGYIVPLESIQFYNLMAVDFDNLKMVNRNNEEDIIILNTKCKNNDFTISAQETLNKALRDDITANKGIIAEKDKQVNMWAKKYQKQRIKTVLIGVGGVIAFISALLLF